MPLAPEFKQSVISAARRAATDTGSPEVQISLLTERIKDLGEHLKTHKKDYASLRGLTLMVSRRHRLLKYLNRVDHSTYTDLIHRLGLRK